MEPSFSLTLSSLTLVLALARPHFPTRARVHPGLGPVTAKETEKTDNQGLETQIGSTMQITCKVTQPSSHTLPQDPLFQPNRRVGYCEFR